MIATGGILAGTYERTTKPTAERRRHNRVILVGEQIVDARGDIGAPYRAEGLLGKLYRRGDISHTQHQAGEEFARLFHTAALQPLRAADMARIPIAGSPAPQHGSERARRKIHEAMTALGGHGTPIGGAAWYILGCDLSIAEWARRAGWGGRPLRDEVAKGILIGSLGVLEIHFGLTSVSETR